jgi:hypothetical protein
MLPIPLNTLRPHDHRCTVFNTCADRLYHYTSIETLALILEYQTIRFNRLDRVNDPLEALSVDYASAQTLVFASCWTAESEESIPLWKMYAGLSGVRICLPTLMFLEMNNNHKVTQDDRLYELNLGGAGINIHRKGKQVHGFFSSVVFGPTKIRYGGEEHLTCTHVDTESGCRRYDLRALGTQKHKHWEFEQEIRFRVLAAFGYSLGGAMDWMSPESFMDSPVVTEFVDVALDPRAIESIQILLGPGVGNAEQLAVQRLCGKYAPDAIVARSTVRIR